MISNIVCEEDYEHAQMLAETTKELKTKTFLIIFLQFLS